MLMTLAFVTLDASPFQFTLPVRGATLGGNRCPIEVQISIHAPRAGSDSKDAIRAAVQELFQSTLPVRGATKKGTSRSVPVEISIHAPRAGSDNDVHADFIKSFTISIHAPRAGSDLILTGG